MQLLIECFATRFGASSFQEEDTIGTLSSRLESARCVIVALLRTCVGDSQANV
jgi:hypothetical protein